MKALFFLLATANIALLFWEYKNGAFVQTIETTVPATAQEQILLTRELPSDTASQHAIAEKTINIPYSNPP